MNIQDTMFKIVNRNTAIGGLPSDRTLRVAKSMGFRTVFFVREQNDPERALVHRTVEAKARSAKLGYEELQVPVMPDGTLANVGILDAKLAQLPKPVLVITHRPQVATAQFFNGQLTEQSRLVA